MELMFLEKKLVDNGKEKLANLLKNIRMLDELIMEDRIKILTHSLIKLGLTENDAEELINDFVLEQLEQTGYTNYKKLEESCFEYAYDNFAEISENDYECEETKGYEDNTVYYLRKKERYEEIFIEAFDSLDYEKQGVIIETVRGDEENIQEDYVNSVNYLVTIISETDEDLANLVQKKMLGEKTKTKTK